MNNMHPDLKALIIVMILIFVFVSFAGVIGAKHQENMRKIEQEHYHDSISIILKNK